MTFLGWHRSTRAPPLLCWCAACPCP